MKNRPSYYKNSYTPYQEKMTKLKRQEKIQRVMIYILLAVGGWLFWTFYIYFIEQIVVIVK